MEKILEGASYVSALLLGGVSAVLFDVFWLPAIPFFLFILQLCISTRLGLLHMLPLGLCVVQIALIVLIAPTSYLFSFLYIFALVIYAIGKMKWGVLSQNCIYIAVLLVMVIKPGMLLLLALKYQRFLNIVHDVVS